MSNRYALLCGGHVARNLVAIHHMIRMQGFGDYCEWCDEPKQLSEFLVDLRVLNFAPPTTTEGEEG